ncbi:MAG: VCBS repeat-containing protein, partial [Deltaproteobacteria bacterium]|nr:VCBS repeat-containing protein [Nannocystaceae bacterium]
GERPVIRRLSACLLAAAACGPTHADCDEATCIGDDGPCLGAPRIHPTEISPLHFVAADFDGDTHVDVLAIGTTIAGAVVAELHRGGADGQLADPVPSAAVGCSAYPIAGDLDGDARADLVYPDCEGNALVFWGDAAGLGASPSVVDMPFVFVTSATGDADGDGIDDLLAFGVADVAQQVLVRGSPSRVLLADAPHVVEGGIAASGVRTGDVDGDGILDAVTWAGGQVDTVAIARGLGDGSFTAPQLRTTGTIAGAVVLGALDTAPGLELVVASPSQQQLVLDAAMRSHVTAVPPYRPAALAIADLAGDVADDLGAYALAVDGFDPEVRYYATSPDGALVEHARLPTPHAAQSVLTPDLDGDGISDVLVGHLAAGAFSLWLSSEWT